MNRFAPLLVVLALALAAPATAGNLPFIPGNAFDAARYYPVLDTISVPARATGLATGAYRGLYAMVPTTGTVRAPVDSLMELWRNVDKVAHPTWTPANVGFAFRRFQHIIFTHNSVDEEQWGLTLFSASGTVHMQIVDQPYQVLDLPVEADSAQVQGVYPKAGATQVDLSYVLW